MVIKLETFSGIKIISFFIYFQFYQRNGQPYPICDKDNLIVEVTEGARRVATLIELGGMDPLAANAAVVKFTVRHAGQYRIAVLIGSCHVYGSPFLKIFLPGTFSFYFIIYYFFYHSLYFIILYYTFFYTLLLNII